MINKTVPKITLTILCSISALCLNSGLSSAAQPAAHEAQSSHIAGAIPDLRNEKDVKTKKRKFFNALRPMVEVENKRIQEQRAQLTTLKQSNSLSAGEQQQLNTLLKSYRLELAKDGSVPWTELFKRVDTVPLELVLSQAANESAWGTSRFARKANNLFGQWCFTKGCGLVPARRNAGTTHEVASFKSPQLSVRSYLRNLNTGRVYADLRTIRATERAAGKTATASQLAGGLSKYSERGQEYVKEIRSMIKYNGKYMRGEG